MARNHDMTKKKYKFIDLFAGLGGFHFALSELGHECVFASELREDLRKLYTINFPGTRIEGDITKINPKDIPAHDILCAGFPCQPFSQAGKRQGFKDEGRGNLFYNICAIIDEHHPRYVFLENVANLKGHDNGNTWATIEQMLKDRQYCVTERILSPHQFGIPQHRKRIYIVGVRKDIGSIDDFRFPEPPSAKNCDISRILDVDETNYIPIKKETRFQLSIWQEFIDLIIKHGQSIPRFPIWAMEFGANYEFREVAPAFQTNNMLRGKRGHLGRPVEGSNKRQLLNCLPIYAQADKSKVFPKWKIRYIEQNREFYNKNKKWLKPWITKVRNFENSHLKFEWNCGDDVEPTIYDKIIQFRASGIRVKLPTFSPALNLVGTQIPIIPWIKLPRKSVKSGEPEYGRYMTRDEAAKLQGMMKLKFGNDHFALSMTRSFEALGNAVNVTIVKHIAKNLIKI